MSKKNFVPAMDIDNIGSPSSSPSSKGWRDGVHIVAKQKNTVKWVIHIKVSHLLSHLRLEIYHGVFPFLLMKLFWPSISILRVHFREVVNVNFLFHYQRVWFFSVAVRFVQCATMKKHFIEPLTFQIL